MTYSKTASSASRSKKWPGPAKPARPRSMMRKNGSGAAKSSRLAMGVFMMAFPALRLLPGRGGPGGELGEGNRRSAGYPEHVAVRAGAVAAGHGGGQGTQDRGVLGRDPDAGHGGDPLFAVGGPVGGGGPRRRGV